MSNDNKFASFMKEIEEEAIAEGPEAVEELEAFREYLNQERIKIQKKLDEKK